MVALGVGSSTGLTSCSRTTRSHTMNSASGPIRGSRRALLNLRGGLDMAGCALGGAAVEAGEGAGVAPVAVVAVMDQPL